MDSINEKNLIQHYGAWDIAEVIKGKQTEDWYRLIFSRKEALYIHKKNGEVLRFKIKYDQTKIPDYPIFIKVRV